MPAGTARSDHNEGSPCNTVSHQEVLRTDLSVSGRRRVSASANPRVRAVPSNEEPPDDTRGSVMPLGGMRLRLTDMLMAA